MQVSEGVLGLGKEHHTESRKQAIKRRALGNDCRCITGQECQARHSLLRSAALCFGDQCGRDIQPQHLTHRRHGLGYGTTVVTAATAHIEHRLARPKCRSGQQCLTHRLHHRLEGVQAGQPAIAHLASPVVTTQ